MTALSPPELVHWCRETKKLASSFQDMSFTHIYREHNDTADRLSKKALTLPQGMGSIMEYVENILVFSDCFQLFWAGICGFTHKSSSFCLSDRGYFLLLMIFHTCKRFSLERWSAYYWLSIDVTEWTVLLSWWVSLLMGYSLIFSAIPPDGSLGGCHGIIG